MVQVQVTASSQGTSRPTFGAIPTSLRVRENGALNSTVTTVTAQSSNGAAVSYDIAGGNIGRAFGVESNTGRIYVKGEVDYELMSEYHLWIEAEQGGSTPATSYAEVVITIDDVNDNKPKFTQAVYEVAIAERTMFGSSILTVTATDADSGLNGEVIYSLSGSNSNLFRIDSDDGEIRTFTNLDRELVDTYSLTVTATDKV